MAYVARLSWSGHEWGDIMATTYSRSRSLSSTAPAMDFMKVLDQTVREIKREVNLKVLKVPEIEQKVLDATNDEPWGPHGTALSEISHATKKFTECQMIMGVLWSRLSDTGPNWRHVYKALTVIEYLIANGSERAVDDILEHTFQISALSSFEYVEPNGKDVGINVRKKVETILALLNDREKIQAIRDKAASNRDKYVGLSSKGISYKSSSASYSSSSYGSGYGSNSRDVDSFSDSYKEGEHGKESKWKNDKKYGQNSENVAENEGIKSKKPVPLHSRNQDSSPTSSLKISNKSGSIPSSKSTTVKSKNEVDDFDDFDPRGSSSAGLAAARSNQVDLFGENLLDDLMDISASVPPTTSINDTANHEVDLFADATFQSAPHAEAKPFSHVQCCSQGPPVQMETSGRDAQRKLHPRACVAAVESEMHLRREAAEEEVGIGCDTMSPSSDQEHTKEEDLWHHYLLAKGPGSDSCLQTIFSKCSEWMFSNCTRLVPYQKPYSNLCFKHLYYLAWYHKGSDLFDSQQEAPVAFDPTADPFAAPGPAIPSETKSPEQPDTKSFDPFAAIPINNFNDSDPFGTFASHGEPVTMQSSQSSPNSGKSNLDEDSIFGEFTSHNEQTTRESSRSNISNLKTPLTSLASTAMKDNFQVKSGVWSDCLSRGLIDLNISAPKKVNLADIGIVGGLDDASMEKEKTLPTAAFMGRAMNSSSGSGLDRSVWSGFSTATGVGGSMSTFGQHEFGGFK
ncbi:hypothetical protein ZIOFF_036452 [Zingiber officinale]|uniref:ENTH domain-containing protein n=1 Tax=Zingiber officinale TaxID=94328 RepID=A0A8J5GQG4_ZINOF|nr:hypothetical protein ZIOFF_036452 [Zingiber officinale]